MFCNKCGSEIPNGSKFCSICGAPVAAPAAAPAEPAAFTMPAGTERAGITPEPAAFAKPAAPAPAPAEPEPAPRRTMFEDINWNVNEYPDRNTVEKTEDVDFNWGADPNEIKDRYTRGFSGEEAAVLRGQTAAPASTGLNVEDLVPGGMRQPQPEPAYQEQPFSSRTPLFDDTDIFGKPAQAEGASLSAADKIDKFYTFSSKNEEFQQLLNREYDKIKGGNVIGQEQSQADKTAAERFETRTQDPSMEAFLEREGVVKPYEPKPVQTDVLERIEAQDQARERERLEQEERARALEEARLQAEAEIRAAAEAKAKAEEEARLAAEEEARIRAEEELRMRQAEEAKARAAEEARLAAEEAARAEEEARKAAAEEARLLAEEEARRKEEA